MAEKKSEKDISGKRASAPRASWDRRGFVGALTAALAGAGSASASPGSPPSEKDLLLVNVDPAHQRRLRAYEIRRRAALQQLGRPLPKHRGNGDEQRLPAFIGTYSKGLPHNDRGEVDPGAYQILRDCVFEPRLFNEGKLILGCPDPARQLRLVNPQAAFAFELAGADPHHLSLPPAPAFESAEAAGEMVEVYWQALLRDTPFREYDSSPLAHLATEELSALPDFQGPKQDGRVTAGTLFRGSAPGDLAGPYLSQFLLKSAPFGVQYVETRMRCPRPGVDFGTEFAEWLDLQRGCAPLRQLEFDEPRRYPRNGRDLAQWVHVDVPFQAYFNAALILSYPPDTGDAATGGGMGAPFSPTNPYQVIPAQEGFGTFGAPHVMSLIGEVATHALKAVWRQKWVVHRRLRPEAYGGRVHLTLSGEASYPVPAELLGSAAVTETLARYGAALLPLAYPEGSPLHPAYGAGHATVAGACVTVLKALFDESFPIENPLEPAADGQELIPYTGPGADQLTVGGELNKLAANISLGRDFAGIHYRSDYWQSLLLGEQVAIRLLEDYQLTFREYFSGFRFTRFDGQIEEIS